MASLIDRHASRIVGVLSCFDRVVIQGTIPSVCHAGAVATLLDVCEIRVFDYGPLFAEPDHEAFVRRNSRDIVPLDLSPAGVPSEVDGSDLGAPYWLIVHSGPEDEVRDDRIHVRVTCPHDDAPERILVATRCSIPLPEGFERIDAATQLRPLFPRRTHHLRGRLQHQAALPRRPSC